MREVPRRRHDHLAGTVRSRVQLAQIIHAERAHGVRRTEDRVPERVFAPECLAMQLEHDVVRRVLDHREFFQDHAALEFQIRLTQRRTEHQIEDHIRRLRQVLVEHARLIRRVFTPGVRVQRTAERLERERQFLGGAALGALEHHVLQEVRDPHLVARLVQGRGPDPRPERN